MTHLEQQGVDVEAQPEKVLPMLDRGNLRVDEADVDNSQLKFSTVGGPTPAE